MSRTRKVVRRVAIGAAIGGIIASLMVVIFFEPRFVVDALQVFGPGGIIGGAICGAIAGMFESKIGAVIGGVIGGMGGCVLAAIGTIFYAAIPWPSPQLYPGAQPLIEGGAGSWGPSRSQTYTVTLRLDDVQLYYEEQMNRYCEGTWRFEASSDAKRSLCREASCRVPRPLLEQYFRVRLCPTTERQTVVTHIDAWQD
jgi:hypothetical protein